MLSGVVSHLLSISNNNNNQHEKSSLKWLQLSQEEKTSEFEEPGSPAWSLQMHCISQQTKNLKYPTQSCFFSGWSPSVSRRTNYPYNCFLNQSLGERRYSYSFQTVTSDGTKHHLYFFNASHTRRVELQDMETCEQESTLTWFEDNVNAVLRTGDVSHVATRHTPASCTKPKRTSEM